MCYQSQIIGALDTALVALGTAGVGTALGTVLEGAYQGGTAPKSSESCEAQDQHFQVQRCEQEQWLLQDSNSTLPEMQRGLVFSGRRLTPGGGPPGGAMPGRNCKHSASLSLECKLTDDDQTHLLTCELTLICGALACNLTPQGLAHVSSQKA